MGYWGGSLAKLAVAVVIGVACGSAPAFAERRVALVIGNGAYVNAPQLPNPKNDAEDVAAALKRSGFDTIVGFDLDKAGMEDATIRFSRAARDADIAIFYYSGHAMQFAGVNYLMPVDARLTDESDLRRMARVDDIVADVQQAKNLRIMVLDSCRDNPLAEQLKRSIGSTRSGGATRGMAKIDSPQGMIVAYSTQAGRTAEDGQGRNSPYTGAFLKHIEAQEEIGTVFRRVSSDVYEGTKRAQLPELSLSLIGEFYLRGRPTFAAPAPLSTTEPKPSEMPAAEVPTKQARLSEPADPLHRDLVTDCDRLAASPYDPKRANGVAGIQPKKIDIVSARTACNDAMRQYPEVSRFIFQAGRVATAQQDYATALSHYRKAIAMGNIPSVTSLGLAYDAGLGVAQDQREGRRWYEKAAALGDAEAMLFLANMAEHGQGTSKDLAEARRWYEKAADAGSTDAQASLKRLSKRR
ncbi:MAG: hypothetical protein JWN71_1477 [Xanthobacteraceae bacterium]|nr:hypothetical protein [Xanthobacteraceae bacterium]